MFVETRFISPCWWWGFQRVPQTSLKILYPLLLFNFFFLFHGLTFYSKIPADQPINDQPPPIKMDGKWWAFSFLAYFPKIYWINIFLTPTVRCNTRRWGGPNSQTIATTREIKRRRALRDAERICTNCVYPWRYRKKSLRLLPPLSLHPILPQQNLFYFSPV